MDESRAVWARDGGSYRDFGDICPCLSPLLSCVCPAGFISLDAFVYCGSSSTPVMCCNFPRTSVDCKFLRQTFQLSLKRFFSVRGNTFLLVARRRAVFFFFFFFWGGEGESMDWHDTTCPTQGS